MADAIGGQGVLTAPYVLQYTYRRSVGPVLSAFFTGLRDGKIVGIRCAAHGGVLVPPTEYDDESGAPNKHAFVQVASEGVVTTWAWVNAPRPTAPLPHPFAWALIRLDGTEHPFLHAVDAGSEARMKSGMRVKVRWRPERVGSILDIACFEPVEKT